MGNVFVKSTACLITVFYNKGIILKCSYICNFY